MTSAEDISVVEQRITGFIRRLQKDVTPDFSREG